MTLSKPIAFALDSHVLGLIANVSSNPVRLA